MRLCTTIAFLLCSLAGLGCSGADTSNFERYQEQLASRQDGAVANTRRGRLARETRQQHGTAAQGRSRTSLARQPEAQPGDAKTAVLGTSNEVIRITTPARDVIEVAPGYETYLRLEGSNLRDIDSLQVTDSSRVEVPGVSASIEEIVSDKVARVSIKADRNVRFDEPLYIQVLAKNNRILAPITIREDVREYETMRSQFRR